MRAPKKMAAKEVAFQENAAVFCIEHVIFDVASLVFSHIERKLLSQQEIFWEFSYLHCQQYVLALYSKYDNSQIPIH